MRADPSGQPLVVRESGSHDLGNPVGEAEFALPFDGFARPDRSRSRLTLGAMRLRSAKAGGRMRSCAIRPAAGVSGRTRLRCGTPGEEVLTTSSSSRSCRSQGANWSIRRTCAGTRFAPRGAGRLGSLLKSAPGSTQPGFDLSSKCLLTHNLLEVVPEGHR